MMTAEQLKGSILQLAMQGKLVEQRLEEGTGEALYKDIQAEKKNLIRNGIIKKQKELPEITEAEIPFDIPETWKWIHVDSSISLLSGADLTPDKYNSNEKGIVYITGASNIENGEVIVNRWTEHAKNIAHKGDLLLTCKGTVGKTAILCLKEAHIARQIMAITPIMCDTSFINYYIQFIVNDLKKKAKSMIPGIERASVLGAPMPLPPLAEQKRIVAKIEELMPFVEQYAAASTKLNTLNTTFPDMMKKSILQEAVQGKLVPQDPNDEPASVLLKKIAEEKKRLIKEGKIKKQKPLPEITEDEIPFDIPESWEWVRLQDLAELITKGSSPKWQGINYVEKGLLFVTSENVGAGELIWNNKKYVDYRFNDISPRSTLKRGDLLTNIVGASIGRTAVYDIDDVANINQAVCLIRLINQHLASYILMYLNSPTAFRIMMSDKVETARPNISLTNIAEFLVPLPPLEEQNRIIKKLMLIDEHIWKVWHF